MAKEKKKVEIDYAAQTQAEKEKALQNAIAQVEKSFGKGSVMKFGQKTALNVPVIPTGCVSVDLALGIGGVARGRIIEVYGPEASGKTTLALHIVSQAQKLGGIVAYVDAEHALDPVYAKKIGVNIDEMYISQPDDGEQALEIAEAMVRSGAIDIVVVDSVAALVPRAEIEGTMGDSHMGLQARLMSQALRKLTAVVNRTNCTVVFINQMRANIGGYGPAETTTGGRALKFYASMRLEVKRTESLKQGNDFIGSRTSVKIAKNKLAPPFKMAYFDIMYGQGISFEGDVLDMASELDIVHKSGSWYSFNDSKIGNGRENVKQNLRENRELFREIENKLRDHHGLPQVNEDGSIGEKYELGPVIPIPKPKKGSKNKGAKASASKKKGSEKEEEYESSDEGGDDDSIENGDDVISVDELEIVSIEEMESSEEMEFMEGDDDIILEDNEF